MSNPLIQQVRKQRELKIPLTDKLTITARRPTDLQWAEISTSGRYFDLGKLVVGWDGFTENDIIGGGGSDPVAFDSELWLEFFEDHSEYWEKVAKSLMDAYKLHADTVRKTEKN